MAYLKTKSFKDYLLLALLATLLLGANYEREAAKAFGGTLLDDDATHTVSVGTSSAQWTVPTAYDPYLLCARDQRVYILCGSNPTVTTTVDEYTISIPSNQCIGPVRLTGSKCAHIAAATGGELEILHFNSKLHYN